MVLEACPVCGLGDHLRDIGMIEGTETGAIAAVCVDCQLGFFRRRPRPEWFDRYYEEEWDTEGQESLPARQPRPRTKVADFCAPHLPEGATVLDMGAGFGRDLLAFAERGFRVLGLERSHHRARFVEERLGIPCAAAPLERYRSPEPPHLAFLNHVFEHVDDPGRVLEHSHQLLPEGGLVYIAVPNLWAEHPPQTFHFVPHLFSYTARALGRLLARHGFRVLRVESDQDVQVLAAKDPSVRLEDGELPGEPGPEEFWRRVEAWAERGLGEPGGDRVLVWHDLKGGETKYESQVLHLGRVRYAMLRRLASSEAPGAGRYLGRRAPDFMSARNLKMLPVRVRGDGDLPIRMSYPGQLPPVWIK